MADRVATIVREATGVRIARVGPGPVYAAEATAAARRWRTYGARSLVVGVMLAALGLVWWSESRQSGPAAGSIAAQGRTGVAFFRAIATTELSLILMLAPAAAAGAICGDRQRGHLDLLFLSDLGDAEVVLGKFAAALGPAVGLAMAALPVLAIGTLLGGIDPGALGRLFAVSLAVALLATAVPLALSVWGDRPHEVLLATFGLWAAWLLASPSWQFLGWYWSLGAPPNWFETANPFRLVLAAYEDPGAFGPWHVAAFVVGSVVVAAGLLALTIGRVRAVSRRKADGPAAVRPLRRGGPALDADPVGWLERRRARLSPWTRRLMIAYVFYFALWGAAAVVDGLGLVPSSGPHIGQLGGYVGGFALAIGLPLLGILAATSLAGERSRGQLDVTLTTPLSSRSIVLARARALVLRLPGFLIVPAAIAAAHASWNGPITWAGAVLVVALGATYGLSTIAIGLALALWLRRPGLAVAATLGVLTAIWLGWGLAAGLIFDYPLGTRLAMAGAYFGPMWLINALPDPVNRDLPIVAAWAIFWATLHLSAAAALLLATLATFDRVTGRLPDAPQRPRPAPPAPVAVAALTLAAPEPALQ